MDSDAVAALSIAHDVNNLLAVILGAAATARDHLEPGSPARAEMAEIVRAAEQAAWLVGRLMELRPRHGAAADVAGIVAAEEPLLRASVPEGTTLSVSVEPGLPAVGAAPGALERVLFNLVHNAGEAQARTVTVHAAPHGDGVRIAIADDGAGMSEDVLARAAEPFFTTKGGGSGLGLAGARRVVRDIGGELSIASAPGRGTTITVDLPAAPPAGAARGETVLIVEDLDAVRRHTRRVLEGAGYTVVEADDASAALEHLDGVDLILCDLGLPGGSGEQVAAAAQAQRPDVRVAFMSGSVVDAGPDVLRKPFTDDGLLRAVAWALGA